MNVQQYMTTPNVNRRNPHLTRPIGLCERGRQAHAIICRFLRAHNACGVDDGGGRFLTPAQWARVQWAQLQWARLGGGRWAANGVLFILHEGSLQRPFNVSFGRADLVFKLGGELRKNGFHLELINGYASAVYID